LFLPNFDVVRAEEEPHLRMFAHQGRERSGKGTSAQIARLAQIRATQA